MAISISRLLTTAWISSASLALAGCSGFVAPPKGSPTMAQVYSASNAGQESYYNSGATQSGAVSIHESTTLPHIDARSSIDANNAQVVNAINSQFPTLPNPQSLMYIFGHYAGADQLPVPGHFVTFPLYNKTYYALPNEVVTPYNDGQFAN